MRSLNDTWFSGIGWVAILSDFNCKTCYTEVSQRLESVQSMTNLGTGDGEEIDGQSFQHSALQHADAEWNGEDQPAATGVPQNELNHLAICKNWAGVRHNP